ncbi:hypothetical protein IG631_20088 [Alternaria alternata]|nr:hypothetical protein IG631_20088 [Alternaria alternata]
MAFDYFANPPPGIDLSESRTTSNNAIGIVLFVLSFVFVALRLLTRLRLKREVLGLDDYLMFLGLALNAGNLACCIAVVWWRRRGTGERGKGGLSFKQNRGSQLTRLQFYLGIGIINLFGDICILTIPVQSVLKLNMGRSQKVAVILTFLLGSFVCFASLYRIITIVHLVNTTDISWAKSDVFIWSSVEPSVGIISGCLPTLRPLLLQVTDVLSRSLPSTLKGSQHIQSPAHSLDPLETISKKRTRKIKVNDTLEGTTVTQTEIRTDRKSWMRSNKDHEPWGRSRLDEDEIGLTTTHVHGECPNAGRKASSEVRISESPPNDRRERGITLTTEFEWDERKQSPVPRK